jgi:hypothetical protein
LRRDNTGAGTINLHTILVIIPNLQTQGIAVRPYRHINPGRPPNTSYRSPIMGAVDSTVEEWLGLKRLSDQLLRRRRAVSKQYIETGFFTLRGLDQTRDAYCRPHNVPIRQVFKIILLLRRRFDKLISLPFDT